MLYSPPSAHNVEPTAQAAHEVSAKQTSKQASARTGKSRRQIRAAAVRQPTSAKHAARPATHAGKGAAKHAQVKPTKPAKKNAVRVAGLKKR
jgi:hypothetical protein